MPIPGDYTLNLFRGRAAKRRAQLFQDADATLPVDLTGCTPAAGITTPDGKLTLACAVVVEDGITAADGWVDITITDEQAALLTGRYYTWTMGVTDSQEDWNPCLKGAVIVQADDSL
jgi:hypothetical protein